MSRPTSVGRFSSLLAAGVAVLVLLGLVVVAATDQPPRDPVADAPAETATADADLDEQEEGGAEVEGESEEDEAAEKAEKTKGRDDYFWKQRLYPSGRLPKGAWLKSRRQAAALTTAEALATDPLPWTEVTPFSTNAANDSWIYGGSTPYSGRITSIATHPTNAQVAWIGTAHGGVWKTSDGGLTWVAIFESHSVTGTLAIGAITVDPANPDRLFVGTGEIHASTSAYFGTGLYRSVDGGATWAKVGGTTFDGCAFTTLSVRPAGAGHVLAGVWQRSYGGVTGCSGRAGLYRSTDGGTTWTRVLTGNPVRSVYATNTPATAYATLYGAGVYKSLDSGGTWSKLNSNLFPAAGIGAVEVTAVASGTLAGTQTLYAAFAPSASTSDVLGIFRSDDGGTSWRRLAQPLYDSRYTAGWCKGQCSYDLVVAADPGNPNQMFAGGVNLNIYNSNTPQLTGFHAPGTTGCPYMGTITNCIHVDFHAMAYDASRRLWIGNDGGIYRTRDGITFANLNSRLNLTQLYPGTSGSLSSGPLVGGAQDNGSMRFAAGGGSALISGGDGGYSAVLGATRNVVLTTSQQLNVWKTINDVPCSYGQTSPLENRGLTEAGTSATPFISVLVGSPTNSAVGYAGSSRVYRTTNGTTGCEQTTWSPISQYFTYLATDGLRYANRIYSIAPARDGRTVYAGTFAGRVYVTDGTSSTWSERGNGLPSRTVTDIWVHPTSPGVAYATSSGFNAATAIDGHLFRTADFGVTWQNVSGNLPDSPANAVVVDTRTNPTVLYVGMDAGVFWSNDAGATWQNTSVGLPAAVVNDLLLDTGPANQLIVTTFGRGWWKAPPIGSASTPAGTAHDAFGSARGAATLPYADGPFSTAAATTQAGEDADPSCTDFTGKTVWYRYTPETNVTVAADTTDSDFDTVLVAYRGTTLTGLTEVGCDDDGVATSGASKIASLALTAGQTYYFQVGGWRQMADGVATSGTARFRLALGAPVHDQFSAAKSAVSVPYLDGPVNTATATAEAGEDLDPSCTDFTGKTVWYRFTAPSAGQYTVDTADSTFDTVLVAYQGATVGALSEVDCNDDGVAASGPSRITNLTLSAGQSIYLQVGGWRATADATAASGQLRVRISQVTVGNDSFASPAQIAALPFSDARGTAQATVEAGEDTTPSCLSTGGLGKTVWYRYTPNSAVTVTADTSGSGFDTVLVAYRGTSLATLTEVGCDDDGVTNSGPSRIGSLTLTAGQTYYFQVGGWRSATGTPASGAVQFHLAAN